MSQARGLENGNRWTLQEGCHWDVLAAQLDERRIDNDDGLLYLSTLITAHVAFILVFAAL